MKTKALTKDKAGNQPAIATLTKYHRTGIEPPIPKLAFSVNESAAAIGVAPITIYRMLAKGVIRASGACRHKIIPRTELERFLRETLE